MANSKRTILVVDNDPDTVLLIRTVLEAEGFAVWEAATGEEAMKLAHHNPNLILIDVRLPGMDGFEVCRNLRTITRHKDIPIILCSGILTEKHFEQGLEVGVNDFLPKPFSIKELKELIRKYMYEKNSS